ncbi:hypothetical protein WT37_13215 [Burkholderia territorii]|nr:hypothetical protein WT37_13215 [Burkholderia territorii]
MNISFRRIMVRITANEEISGQLEVFSIPSLLQVGCQMLSPTLLIARRFDSVNNIAPGQHIGIRPVLSCLTIDTAALAIEKLALEHMRASNSRHVFGQSLKIFGGDQS